MTAALLFAAVVLPVTLAPLVFLPGGVGRIARSAAPWLGFPVLLLAALPVAHPPLDLPWLLLGARFELDGLGRVFLLFSSALWGISGWYARAYVTGPGAPRYLFFALITMAGNLGLPLSADAASFYLFFAVMTFGGFGLVVHSGDPDARRAGRVYLGLAVVGEAFLIAGLLLAVMAAGSSMIGEIPSGLAGSPYLHFATGALLLGFGIKAGAVPLHVWLPLAHPVAPTPASAVLSGSMIKAGLLGWLRFLPLGEVSLTGWGVGVVSLGVAAAFFGVVIGMLQTDPKTVLAYSSISQMGVMNIGVGVALAVPEARVAAVGALSLYALHHGLAKGALFLGVGVVSAVGTRPGARGLVAAGMLLPALAIAGAPLTSGGIAKGQLKALVPLSPGPWPLWLEWALPLSAFATTLLMARFLVLTAAGAGDERGHPAGGLLAPWVTLLGLVAASTWLLPRVYPIGVEAPPGVPGFPYLVIEVLPVVAGGIVFWLAIEGRRWFRARGQHPAVAPGDVLVLFEAWAPVVAKWFPGAREGEREPIPAIAERWYRVYAQSGRHDLLLRLEFALTRWNTAILLTLLVMAILILLLAAAS
jgi:formate hydrogenlyase subunit 3/multisubunit Na+/H+ antiporter MnhD subunit